MSTEEKAFRSAEVGCPPVVDPALTPEFERLQAEATHLGLTDDVCHCVECEQRPETD